MFYFSIAEYWYVSYTNEEYIKLLGANIKIIRLKLNLTHQELAYKCEIEKSNLIRIEAGRTNPTVKTLKLLADNLNTTVAELFSFEINSLKNLD